MAEALGEEAPLENGGGREAEQAAAFAYVREQARKQREQAKVVCLFIPALFVEI